MEWVVVRALATLVGALYPVVREVLRNGHG